MFLMSLTVPYLIYEFTSDLTFVTPGSLWLNTNSGLNEDKAEIVVADFHGGINQQWILEVGNETTIADVLTES